jgi:hypothetical protein
MRPFRVTDGGGVSGRATVGGAAVFVVLGVLPTSIVPRAASQEEAPQVYGLDEVDRLPRMTEVREPPLSRRARETGLDGTVIVEGVIGANGRVAPSSARVLKALHPLLDEASVRALLASWFSPALREGRPVAVRLELPYTYELSGRGTHDPAPRPGTHVPVGIYAAFDVVYASSRPDAAGGPAFIQLWRRSTPGEDPGDLDSFSPGDTLIAEVALPGAPRGTRASGRWLYTRDDSKRLIVESDLQTAREGDEAIFKAWTPDPWPEGTYVFEAIVDGQPGPPVPFRVTR